MNVVERFHMQPHPEGGAYCLLDEQGEASAENRGSHGVIYYALRPGEHADFHAIDCDEYWLWHCGCTLEIWIYAPDGKLTIKKLGMTEDAEPCVLVKAGYLFGARSMCNCDETTLLSCVTVPQFTYDRYRLLRKEEMTSLYPSSKEFFGMA